MFRTVLSYLGFKSARKGMLSRVPGAKLAAPLLPFVRLSSILPIAGGYLLWRNRDKVKGYLGGAKNKLQSQLGQGESHRIGTNDVAHHPYP